MIFSLVTGAAVALCIDVLNTHDIKLARNLYSFLKSNDVLVGDRAFCAYADMFTIKKLKCDAVFRKHQSRTTTMRKGKIVGDCDKLVIWYKPKSCLKGLSKDEFNALPLSITVREIYYDIFIPGFRTQRVSLITTLLDKKTYSTLDLDVLQARHDHPQVAIAGHSYDRLGGCGRHQRSQSKTLNALVEWLVLILGINLPLNQPTPMRPRGVRVLCHPTV